MKKQSLYVQLIASITLVVLSISSFIYFYVFANFKERLIKQVPQSSVETMVSLIKTFEGHVKTGEMTIEEAQKVALWAVEKIRLENNNYFWVQSTDSKMIFHPIKKEMNGQYVSGVKDPNGKSIFSDISALAQSQNQGWYEYSWEKPGEKGAKRKSSYFHYLPEWNWVIASGEYYEDIESRLASFFREVELSLAAIFALALLGVHFLAKKVSNRLSGVSSEVDGAAINLSEATSEINDAIDNLASVATQQASAIQESAAAIHEIHLMSEQNAQSARSAAKFSEDNSGLGDLGKSSLGEMEDSISSLERVIYAFGEQFEGEVKKLDDILKSMSEIEEKSSLINEIVFQTKLLSFNASVEAARAGEHGRGFAVVAEEIGSLAQKSAESAKVINEIIEASRERVTGMITQTKSELENLTHNAQTSIESGQRVNQNFSELFSKFIENTTQMGNYLGSMASASLEQGQGIDQINCALEQLAQASQESMAATEQIRGRMLGLKSDTVMLKGSVHSLEQTIHGEVIHDLQVSEELYEVRMKAA